MALDSLAMREFVARKYRDTASCNAPISYATMGWVMNVERG